MTDHECQEAVMAGLKTAAEERSKTHAMHVAAMRAIAARNAEKKAEEEARWHDLLTRPHPQLPRLRPAMLAGEERPVVA